MRLSTTSRSEVFKLYWKGASFLSENRILGGAIGAILFPLELALTSVLEEGPSTEICVAKRKA